jgi:hypothetical protein
VQRRISSFVAVGLLVFLAGCGGGGGSDSNPNPPPVDTTPNAFTFTPQSGMPVSTGVASNEVVIAGLSGNAAVSITGGEYSINGAAFTSAAGTISNGQSIRVRVTGSSQFSTPASAVLTVGGVSATFTATTVAADTTPDAFTFAGMSGAALSTVVGSNEIVIAGINTSSPVSITGGEYSINDGAYTAAAGTVTEGQRVRVRLTSSGLFSMQVSAVLTVGGVQGTFAATTLAADTTPDAFQFGRKINAVRNAWVSSDSVAIAGINFTTPVSITNGEYSIAGGAFTSAAGSIVAGQSLVVRVRASSSYSSSTRARVTVGTVSVDFDVTSELPVYVPDRVAYDGQNIIYLQSNANRLIFRWSVSESRYLDPYTVGLGALNPTSMAYSTGQQRLYVGYETGAIRYIDPNAASAAEVALVTMSAGVTSLSNAGNFLVAQTGNYSYGGGAVLSSSGATVANGGYYYGYSRETAWDPVSSRLYYSREGISPNDLHYDVINQATGQITSSAETPYHGAYSILPPIRVSVDGAFILMGSGDIYSRAALNWSGSLGSQVTDARWSTDGSIVTLTTANSQTTLRRRGATTLPTLEQRSYAGQALRVIGTDARMAVLVITNGTLEIHTYIPNDDSDGDGVVNTQDAFPLDRAASVDTDRDGYPDSWNAGRSQADSTTGLVLDAFPQDAACWLSGHGSGGVCNYGATLPDYEPDRIVHHGDIVYLLSTDNERVYRWSISAQAYLNPYVVGIDEGYTTLSPTTMTYSVAHQRLYLGYESGAIHYIDVASGSPAEISFANTAMGVHGLVSVGNYLLAQDDSGAWETHYVFNASGAITAQQEWNYYSTEYAWDPVNSRVYFFRSNTSPGDLHYEVINQATGQISSSGETPYHGDHNFGGVIRVSASGQYVLVGAGDFYTQPTLQWSGAVGTPIADARWFANGSLATLVTSGNQTQLRRLSGTNLTVQEQRTFSGQALRVVGSDTSMVVVVMNNGTVQFHGYVPNDDSDGDGVTNTLDAFPLDVAASLDADHDGYPDSWNPGRSAGDSTTGLTLDAFPQDSACWLSAHGSGGVCNYGATIPNYTPDQVAQQGDVIYLLSTANRRVYRWSISTGAYLNPYVVGINQGFTTAAPTKMAHSAAHNRLYLGYSTGAIRYIDTNSASPVETAFVTLGGAIAGLTSAGNFLAAHAGSIYSSNNSNVISSSGVTMDQGGGYYYATDYTWDPVTSRLYYATSGYSSYALYYEVISQATGEITSTGNSAYNSSTVSQPPARVSQDGQYVVLGSGEIYGQSGLTWSGTLGSPIADARWFANGSLATLATSGGQTMLRRLGSTNLAVLEQRTFTGQALRVVGSDALMVVLVINNDTVEFHNYVPNNDSDADGVTNTADAFPLDRAASVDSDQDGYPDAWNAGRSQADSTTGLTLDAFPADAACWLSAHGSGGVCNYGATIPSYIPDQVVQQGDVVYLLSSANRRVYRWSIATAAYLNPYVVGINQGFSILAPTKMAYSANHQRLYLGYGTGAIRYIDVNTATPVEAAFVSMPTAVTSLTSAGNFLVALASNNYSSNGSYVLNSSGVTVDQGSNYYYSNTEHTWDPVNSRLYYINSYSVAYEVINQTTGEIGATGSSPYNSNSYPRTPIRVSVSGQHVLVGNGDFFAQSGLTWAGSLGSQITDARWFTDGSLATLVSTGNQTTLRRLGASSLTVLEQRTFTGEAWRVVGSDTAMVVLVNNGGTVQFHSYVPNDDSDADGVTNTADAFPLDRAASVDTDGDGYPDSWNPGRSQSDSTTGLTLDAFPTEAACWQSAHGSGGVCNYGATIPSYTPDQVVQQGDIVYLLSIANRRVYRWSIATGAYLNPYVVGSNQGYSTMAPTAMAYSTGHQRLYLGYSTGAIRYIDVNAGPAEVAFTTMPQGVSSLSNAGNFLLAQTVGGYSSGYILNSSGAVTGQGGYYYGYSRETAWDPVYSRVYYTRDGISPNDLHYDEIDQVTGEVTETNETPYHGSFSFNGPIRVSTDGERILLGGGDIYMRDGMTRQSSLGKAITDAHWKDNVVVDVDTTDLVEIRDANSRAVLRSYQYLGTPIRVVFGTSEAYLVHVMNGTTAFVRLPFYDEDGDSIERWWEQLYGLSDSNAADALTDLDSDGVNNQTEFLNLSNPTLSDSDADGLSDSQEIVTYNTNPIKADSDGDGLNDYAEAITHQTDPLDADSDNDGYSDLVEVLYGGDPNDPSGLPQPLTSYTQTFEGTDLDGWVTPAQSHAPWARELLSAHSGTGSYKSGPVIESQISSTAFRGFFRPGQLSFWARSDAGYCCNRFYLYVDGVQRLYVPSGTTWNQYSIQLTLGIHEIEWRYEKDYYYSGGQTTDAARIDDVVFVGQ